MGSIKDFFTRHYYGIAGSGSVMAGIATFAATAPALGVGGALLGAGVGAVGGVGTILLKPRTDEEIEQLLGRDAVLQRVLEAADDTSDMDPEMSNKLRIKRDIRKIKEIMDRAMLRRGILEGGEQDKDLLDEVAEISKSIIYVVNKSNMLADSPLAMKKFEDILHKVFPETLELFYRHPHNAKDPSVRENFSKQLNTIHGGVLDAKRLIDEGAHNDFEAHGFYLESKYGKAELEA